MEEKGEIIVSELNQEGGGGEEGEGEEENNGSRKIWKGLSSIGSSLLFGMEYVGEIIADVLGLDDSKFQDVIDSMTEEDWRIAIQVTKTKKEKMKSFSYF